MEDSTKSKTSKPISAQKSKMKKGESEGKEKIGVSMPFPLEVCDAIGLDIGETVKLWNQFDEFDNSLRDMLLLLENWSEALEKKLFAGEKEKIRLSKDSKERMSKSLKRPDIQSVLQQSKKKPKDSQKMDEENAGLPIVIVNSSDIESDLVKSLLSNQKCFKGLLSFESQLVSQKNNSDKNNSSKPPDITFLHIKKQWFSRTNDQLENSFSIKSLDMSNIPPSILKMQDLNIEVERLKSSEDVLSGEADDGLPVEKSSLRNGEINEEEPPKDIADQDQYVGAENENSKRSSVMSTLQERIVLGPGESVGYNICYSPMEKGVHKSSLTVELSGWQKKYCVNISGISDVPQLDSNPEVIFSKCSPEKPTSPHALYSPTYFHNIQALDFGLLPAEKKLNVCAVSKLNFLNISHVHVKAKFTLQPNQGNFVLDKDELDLEANESGSIYVTASPKHPHKVQELLVCEMNDNPEVISLQLTSVGYNVKVQLLPKQLNFGQVLIFRKHWLNLSLKNLCATSLYWCITSSDFIEGEEFIARPVDGLLDVFSTSEIEIEFAPKNVQLVTKKPLKVEVGSHILNKIKLH
ncbi:hydrocephalus-inducing protein homolog [Ischnura elegans]|uniref:hydrocephalus-inducing protein homolog n=1 Tax=Ischnura elegans TaxID=197161 RepID=UPI001ED8A11F|nr:hydrocephalus-inducing protein homolog [Ischnura elegans]